MATGGKTTKPKVRAKKPHAKASKKRTPSKNVGKKGKATSRWQVVENVVAAYEHLAGLVPGMSLAVHQKKGVPRTDINRKPREVDVLVELPVGGRTIWIGVDVKAEKRPLTVEAMGTLIDKKSKIATDRFCVISTSGFTPDAEKDAREAGIETATLEEFKESLLFKVPSGGFMTQRIAHVIGLTAMHDGDIPEPAAKLLEAVLIGPVGRVPLMEVANNHAYHVGSRYPTLLDGAEFPANALLTPDTFTEIEIEGIRYPAPTALYMTCRMSVVPVPDRRFRLHGIEMVTGEVPGPNGTPQQVTLALVPLPDGSLQPVSIFGPAQPKRTDMKPKAR